MSSRLETFDAAARDGVVPRRREAWDAANADANAQALAVVRSAVPPDVRHGWTVERLVARGLPQKLAARVLRVRALWLVRMAPETIAKMHVCGGVSYNLSSTPLTRVSCIWK